MSGVSSVTPIRQFGGLPAIVATGNSGDFLSPQSIGGEGTTTSSNSYQTAINESNRGVLMALQIETLSSGFSQPFDIRITSGNEDPVVVSGTLNANQSGHIVGFCGWQGTNLYIAFAHVPFNSLLVEFKSNGSKSLGLNWRYYLT